VIGDLRRRTRIELGFSRASLQPASEADVAFPPNDTLQHNYGDALTVEVPRYKSHSLVSEFRSQLDPQLPDDDGGTEVAPERKDNALFCRNVSLVMSASYSFERENAITLKKSIPQDFQNCHQRGTHLSLIESAG